MRVLKVGDPIKDQYGGEFKVVAKLPSTGVYVLEYNHPDEHMNWRLCGSDRYVIVEVDEELNDGSLLNIASGVKYS
jgi:hypothetical protein